MQVITPEDVLKAFKAAAGEPVIIPPLLELPETTFGSLGYDSLALLETTSELEQSFGIKIPDSSLLELTTLRELMDLVNAALAEPDQPATCRRQEDCTYRRPHGLHQRRPSYPIRSRR